MLVDEVEDAGAALVAFGDLRRVRDAAERDIFLLAARFADFYHVDTARTDHLRSLPGTEREIKVAGDGAPLVLEFAIAEMAAELGITTWSARRKMGDALETRHRLPLLWARVRAGEVPAWIAAKVARATRPLTRAQAAFVDDQLVEYADGRLPWSRFVAKLEAVVIDADPDAAAARERAAAAARFAKVGQSNDHGQRTLYVKTSAAEMSRIDATIAYLADALKALGDLDDEDRRRTKAVLLMANPDQALTLLQAIATHRATTPTGGAGPATTGGTGGTDRADGADGADDEPVAGTADGNRPGPGGGHGAGDPAGPASGPGRPPWADDDLPLPDPDDPGPEPADPEPDPGPGDTGDAPRPAAGGMNDPDPPEGVPPDPLAGFYTPFHPEAVSACPCRGGTFSYDTRTLLPTLTLYLHMHADTLARGNGVIRCEDLGPLSALYLRDFLGPHAVINLKPVIDPAGLAPVDAYEIPDRHREALHLRTPADAFPYAPNTGRRKQADHTKPYRSRAHGGGPGQTSLDNLGGMTQFHHRVKTHGRWQLQQPFPGIYLWQSPHGSIFLVDHTGTRQIRRPHTRTQPNTTHQPPGADQKDPTPAANPGAPNASGIQATPRLSALEDHFAALINAA